MTEKTSLARTDTQPTGRKTTVSTVPPEKTWIPETLKGEHFEALESLGVDTGEHERTGVRILGESIHSNGSEATTPEQDSRAKSVAEELLEPFDLSGVTELSSAIAQSLGAASVCWTWPSGSLDTDRLEQIQIELERFVRNG